MLFRSPFNDNLLNGELTTGLRLRRKNGLGRSFLTSSVSLTAFIVVGESGHPGSEKVPELARDFLGGNFSDNWADLLSASSN